MLASRPQIVVLGSSSAARAAAAAAVVSEAIGNGAQVVALTHVPLQAALEQIRLASETAGLRDNIASVAACEPLPDCDLLILVDSVGSDAQPGGCTAGGILSRSPAGGYMVVWPGPDPVGAATEEVMRELRGRAKELANGMLGVATARARRRNSSNVLAASTATTCIAAGLPTFHELVGSSDVMQKLYRSIVKVGRGTAPVLVLGESGTGKEAIARALHAESPRSGKPFVTLNCATVAGGTLESDLFGHVRGAFTGAVGNRKGHFREADGGTLFLDEIGDLALPVQAKLLRTLESGEIRPVGSDNLLSVNVRVIAATHKDIARGVADGWFREDLYHRLAVCVVRAPALREHPEDLFAITAHILKQLSLGVGRTYAPVPEPVALLWQAYHWPGNVRELRNLLTRAVLDASGTDLPPHALVPELTTSRPGGGPLQSSSPAGTPALTVEAVERAIAAENGNRVRAARRLGVSRSTLYRHLGK